jgi:hypothetical protein
MFHPRELGSIEGRNRARAERPRGNRAAECRDEIPPSHHEQTSTHLFGGVAQFVEMDSSMFSGGRAGPTPAALAASRMSGSDPQPT